MSLNCTRFCVMSDLICAKALILYLLAKSKVVIVTNFNFYLLKYFKE